MDEDTVNANKTIHSPVVVQEVVHQSMELRLIAWQTELTTSYLVQDTLQHWVRLVIVHRLVAKSTPTHAQGQTTALSLRL